MGALRGISTREDWAWQPVTLERWPSSPRLGVKWHYPGAYRYRYPDHDLCLQAVKSWDLYHRRKGSRMLEYSGLVCQHLYFIEGRSRWGDMMWRPACNGTVTLNTNHLGFQLLAGGQDSPPTDLEVQAMGEVTARARAQGAGPQVLGHRDGYATACPGDALYRRLPDIRRIADNEGDDMPTLDELKKLFDQHTTDVARRVNEVLGDFDAKGEPNAKEPFVRAAARLRGIERGVQGNAAAIKRLEAAVARLEATVTPVDPDDPEPEPCDGYTVLEDETAWGIARKLGITFDDLKAANPDHPDLSQIKTGECLKVPAPKA